MFVKGQTTMSRTIHFALFGLVLSFSFLLPLFRNAEATIILFRNETLSFPSVDSSFTPPIPEAGIIGEVYAAHPLNGCSAFSFEVTHEVAFAIVQRGDCFFEDKVRNSQNAGFTAAIIFDNDNNDLVKMSGNGADITTYALFVSNAAGERLLRLEGTVYILPGYKRTMWVVDWLILSVSLVVVVIVGALLSALCCIRAHILAEAEKDLREKLLQDDDHIRSQFLRVRRMANAVVAIVVYYFSTSVSLMFLNHNLNPAADREARAEDAISDTKGEHENFPTSEDSSESDHAPGKNHIVPN